MATSAEPAGPWEERVVYSVEELVALLSGDRLMPVQDSAGGHRRSGHVFRGMSVASWSLQTSLERLGSEPDQVEGPLLRNFRKSAPMGMFSGASEWEVLAVAQHNGLPTRCLDWTASPMVAAHFATCERPYLEEDGVIWCLDVGRWRSQLLPKALLKVLRKDIAWVFHTGTLAGEFPGLLALDDYLDDRDDLLLVFEPPSIDERIRNQYGLLTMLDGATKSHQMVLAAAERAVPGLVLRIVIPGALKPLLRDFLDQNNITERMLFPGLPGTADWLRRHYGPA
ncbi:MAG: FRG domain-containing protein [Myxococcales bacterium]|nr:FRG domain-containing protein [Myxococcales bacterium]MCB9712530.1 FRG domain-containing protein [Myxococcales bacterium]